MAAFEAYASILEFMARMYGYDTNWFLMVEGGIKVGGTYLAFYHTEGSDGVAHYSRAGLFKVIGHKIEGGGFEEGRDGPHHYECRNMLSGKKQRVDAFLHAFTDESLFGKRQPWHEDEKW